MEKTLRLYKLPEIENIVYLVAITDGETPDIHNEGDKYIDKSNDRLYEARMVNNSLVWVRIQPQVGKYYIYKDNGNVLCFDRDFSQIDLSFPENSRLAEITSFSYDATRMGNAPTISGTLMYRDCLDELWTDRVCTIFNGVFYFLDKLPTSEYSNQDARYKHSLTFVSEYLLLEKVYFANVVDFDNMNDDVSQWYDFSFFSDIQEFINRLNESLKYSTLHDNGIGFSILLDTDDVTTQFIAGIEEKNRLISISDTTVKEALDMIYSTWGVPYYYDGYTIHIGFSNTPLMEAAGETLRTFEYGAVNSLLSIQKNQNNDIINRITGFGGSDNLPWFYPNKTPNGIALKYLRNGQSMNNYAKISNPYRTVNIEPSTSVVDNVPNGTYFKYMKTPSTYTYDQFVAVNPHHFASLINNKGTPSLVVAQEENENIRVLFNYGDPNTYTDNRNDINVFKKMFVWLGAGTKGTVTILDKMDKLPFQEFASGGQFIAAPITCTRAKWEEIVSDQRGYTMHNPKINLTYTVVHTPMVEDGVTTIVDTYTWSDGTTTTGYNEKFPIDLTGIGSSETAFVIWHKIKIPYGVWHGYYGSNAIPLKQVYETYLKNGTQSVLKIEKLSDTPLWVKNPDNLTTALPSYGIRLYANIEPQEGDIIYFEKDPAHKDVPFSKLVPSDYFSTGDVWLNARNNTYLKENSETNYYSFGNLYKFSSAREHIENFEDIKPTIKGTKNQANIRIDMFRDIAFDAKDNNEINTNGNGYQHSFFFAKLARTNMSDSDYSFNLFDCAVDGENMKVSMTSGVCGGGTFEIMVKYQSDGTAINPVAVFTEDTVIDGVTYRAGTPKRDSQGNVLLNEYQEIQQDTSAYEVWIALKKDSETFATGNVDIVYGSQILPDSTSNIVPATSDTFVILNINLPIAYVKAAERKLHFALLDYMEKENARRFGFSIKFSSIYYRKNHNWMDRWFNESAQAKIKYNNITKVYYVQAYSYKMNGSPSLPEVTIELNEEARKPRRYRPVQPSIRDPFDIESERPLQPNTPAFNRAVNRIIENGKNKPTSASFDNLQISGDIILADGTSLNAQITAFASNIYSNETIRTRESVWASMSERAEMQNLFIDGTFAYDYNKFTIPRGGSVTQNDYGYHGNSSIKIFVPQNRTLTIQQKVSFTANTNYTLIFYAKSERTVTLTAGVAYGSSTPTIGRLQTEQEFLLDSSDWVLCTMLFGQTNSLLEYVNVFFASDMETDIDIDGIIIVKDNFTNVNQDGVNVANNLVPKDYKIGNKEIKTMFRRSLNTARMGSVCHCTADTTTGLSTDSTLTVLTTDFEIREGTLLFVLFNNNILNNGTLSYSTVLSQAPIYYCGAPIAGKVINRGDYAILYCYGDNRVELLFITRWGMNL